MGRHYSTPTGWQDQAGAAAFLGVTVATVRRWSRRDGLPFYRIGHRALYREKDLTDWLEARREVHHANDNRRAGDVRAATLQRVLAR